MYWFVKEQGGRMADVSAPSYETVRTIYAPLSAFIWGHEGLGKCIVSNQTKAFDQPPLLKCRFNVSGTGPNKCPRSSKPRTSSLT